MTNKEKKERIQKEDGKAFETFNIERDVTYLNQKYTLSKQTANVMTGNGLLKEFELNPSEGGPSFIGRWDGGSRDPGKTERYDLDIDIYRVSREEKRRFNKGEREYSGHHTTKVESTEDINTKFLFAHRRRRSSRELFALTYIARSESPTRSPCATEQQPLQPEDEVQGPRPPLVDNFYYQTPRAGLFQLSSCFYASPKNLVPMKFAGGFGGGMIMPAPRTARYQSVSRART